MKQRITIIVLSIGVALLATTTALGFLTRPAAVAPRPAKFPPVACEGYGATSFCHVTIAPDGTEYLFDEDRNGTIILIRQTPPN